MKLTAILSGFILFFCLFTHTLAAETDVVGSAIRGQDILIILETKDPVEKIVLEYYYDGQKWEVTPKEVSKGYIADKNLIVFTLPAIIKGKRFNLIKIDSQGKRKYSFMNPR